MEKAQREGESGSCWRDDEGREWRRMVMAAVIVTRDGDGDGRSGKRYSNVCGDGGGDGRR